MRFIPHIFLLFTFITTVNVSILSNIRDNVLSYLKRSLDSEDDVGNPNAYHAKNEYVKRNFDKDSNVGEVAENKMSSIKETKMKDKFVYNNKNNKFWFPKASGPQIDKNRYQKDSVLNSIQARSDFRRDINTDSSDFSSSSIEIKDWKKEWRENWIKKKIEAVNSSQPTGDQVNMVAARPWGVPCGDPNQHDMPWGTCMLPSECESEYRIYRGDYFCGRTQFVCCSLQLHTYDMYQGFDVSFADSSLATDTEEKKYHGKDSREKRKRKKRRAKKKRKRDRDKRKRRIKKTLRKIIKEIRKILSRTYRNGTSAKKKKTKQLKKFIKHLKKQYKNDRQSVKDIHEFEMISIDAGLQKRLFQIMQVNQNFIRNNTFKDLVTNGTMNKQGARMLIEAYPELASYFPTRRNIDNARQNRPDDYLEYDIEYGLIYY